MHLGHFLWTEIDKPLLLQNGTRMWPGCGPIYMQTLKRRGHPGLTIPTNQDEPLPTYQDRALPTNQDEPLPTYQDQALPTNQDEALPINQDQALLANQDEVFFLLSLLSLLDLSGTGSKNFVYISGTSFMLRGYPKCSLLVLCLPSALSVVPIKPCLSRFLGPTSFLSLSGPRI